MQKIALRIAGGIFLLVAALHLVRAFTCVAVFIGGAQVPLYVSWIGGVASLLLAAWMFRASGK